MLQLSPDQQVIKSFATNLPRSRQARKTAFRLAPAFRLDDRRPAGLGKTTTTGKLSRWLTLHGHRPLVVSTDVYRPRRATQLAQVAKAVGTAVWPGAGTDKPLEIVRGAIKEAKLPRPTFSSTPRAVCTLRRADE